MLIPSVGNPISLFQQIKYGTLCKTMFDWERYHATTPYTIRRISYLNLEKNFPDVSSSKSCNCSQNKNPHHWIISPIWSMVKKIHKIHIAIFKFKLIWTYAGLYNMYRDLAAYYRKDPGY